MRKEATISSCGKYRYWLARVWDESLERVGFLMLNPSTADAEKDDQTIRRCIGFAKAWGFGGIEVVNLFAWRATNPCELVGLLDPIGSLNNQAIRETRARVPVMVAAWGANDVYDRDRSVMTMLAQMGGLHHMGLTKSGAPKHPLARGKAFIPYSVELRPLHSPG